MSGHLAGAGLDVIDGEWRTDLEAHPLIRYARDHENLVITPHCSSDDRELYTPKTLDLLFDNLERLIAGKPLRNRVSAERQY